MGGLEKVRKCMILMLPMIGINAFVPLRYSSQKRLYNMNKCHTEDMTPLLIETNSNQLRQHERWDAAIALLEATVDARRRFDHRANKARLVALYVSNNSTVDFIVAVQPDRSLGRKFIFLDANGNMVGHMLVETSNRVGEGASSALRGMFVDETLRGKGYSKLFLATWMRLCLEARIVPSTTRINKPLLALTLQRFGFSPLPDKVQDKPNKRSLVVEVSLGDDGNVSLYSECFRDILIAGFSATEMSSQRLVVVHEPSEKRGKDAHIRTKFDYPPGLEGLDIVTTSILGSRLRLCANHEGNDVELTTTVRSDVIRALYGRL